MEFQLTSHVKIQTQGVTILKTSLINNVLDRELELGRVVTKAFYKADALQGDQLQQTNMPGLGMHGLGPNYANRVDGNDNAMDIDMPKFDHAHDGDYEKNMDNMF